ncbi:hypothetical protein EDB81DRAFT_804757 [Dactylonectria macrodidyma]|uniref:Cyanovirin-N domain-containing protein n=1 Tax=Dactylonectria macrodidyma TaxID=307937 RepID=A0A9P9E929_9HYPO|nr:hypothetical protein EDB81DRAFT_804757 [Dactylonectria macrodidyma]
MLYSGIKYLVLGLAWLHVSLAVQSFSQGCQPMDAQLYSDDAVGFYCFPEDPDLLAFSYAYSLIELRHCIANNGGSLVAYSDGNYQESCENCILESVRSNGYRTCYLKCNCYNRNKQPQETVIDLNHVLFNDNARLACFGYRGTRDRASPECHKNVECSTGSARLTPRAEPT